LDMIGGRGDGSPVFGLMAIFFHAPNPNILKFIQYIGLTVLFAAILLVTPME
jgi:hypothetical protein